MGRLEDRIASASERLQREKAKQEVKIPIINGLSAKEKRRITYIHNRIAFLYKQIKNMPTQSMGGARREITVLEWVLKTLREHYDHLNICEMDDEGGI